MKIYTAGVSKKQQSMKIGGQLITMAVWQMMRSMVSDVLEADF